MYLRVNFLFRVDSQSQLHMENYPDSIHFDVKVETSLNQVYKLIQNTLKAYKGEVTKPTILILQASMSEIMNIIIQNQSL